MDVYEPAEDSYLIQKQILKDLAGKKVLDMGTGTGILAITAAKAGAMVTAVDCNKDAIKVAKENAKKEKVKIKFIHSDLFSKVRGKFDLILCNPPYLPEDEIDKLIGPSEMYSGGKTGRQFIERFVKSAPKYLKKSGKLVMVFSTLTGEKEVLDLLKQNGFETKILARQKIPWEELIVIEARLVT